MSSANFSNALNIFICFVFLFISFLKLQKIVCLFLNGRRQLPHTQSEAGRESKRRERRRQVQMMRRKRRRTWSENLLVLLQLERLKSVIRCEWHLCDARRTAEKKKEDNRRLYLSRFVQTDRVYPHIRSVNIAWKYDFGPTMEMKNEPHKCLSQFAHTTTTTAATETRVISDANFRNVAKCLKYEIVLLRIVLSRLFVHFPFTYHAVPSGKVAWEKNDFWSCECCAKLALPTRRQIEWWT